jgi:hypothetical protein
MIRRILLFSICLSIFLINVSAQDNPFPNEIDGLKFTKQATFRGFKFLVSTKDDIASIFGRHCDERCRYDDNWDVQFSYVTKEEKQLRVKNGVTLTYKVRPEFIGKLISVDFVPRKPQILPESLVIPKGLYCLIPTGPRYPNPEKIMACWDGSSLGYRISTQDDLSGEYKKNEVVVVTYGASTANRDNIYETEPERAKPKN